MIKFVIESTIEGLDLPQLKYKNCIYNYKKWID